MIPYSDLDLQDPAEYYGGFKAGRLERHGIASRTLSDPWTGEWQGGSYDFRLIDPDLQITRRKASPTGRFWTEPVAVRMTNRRNRADLGTPWTVWVGPILEAQPSGPLAWDFTLGDIVSTRLLSDKFQLPYRLIRDGFLSQLDEINPDLDLEQPEPIIYGDHRRVAEVDAASPNGFVYAPALLGKWTVDTTQYYVWLIAGHACSSVEDIRVDGAETFEGSNWLIPTHANHTATFGTSYQDLVSDTFGTTRRYTLLYGVVGDTEVEEVVAGEKTLAVTVSGIETVGDGTGILITDRFQQYKHFCINFVANAGADSYHTGPWLTNPIWSIFDADIPIVDGYSFDNCSAIAAERLPDNEGYIGAAIIGAKGGDQSSVLRWIADWNRSTGGRFGVTHRGRIRLSLLHPTEAVKATAPLDTDAYEILDQSFSTNFSWASQANQVQFRADFEHVHGQWRTNGVVVHTTVNDYGPIPSEMRDYPFAPGITAANHLAVLEARQRAHPPQVVVLEATVGPNPVTGESLGYAELGDYRRYKHFAAVGEEAQIRLGQVIGLAIDTGARKVRATLLDCEDLIDFDAPDVPVE